MTAITNRWPARADALYHAWIDVTGAPPPNRTALRLVLAQAQFESQCGDAWNDSGNWGATDLRALTTAERAAFAAGDLKIGFWLYPDGTYGPTHRTDATGVLQGDSDPNTGGFRVWFAAFPTDEQGATYMLRAGVRGARHALDNPDCTPAAYATALYVDVCYFGGVHAGGRPCGKRKLPLTPPEAANVADYAAAISRQLPAIDAGLADWVCPGPWGSDTFTENVTDNPGDAEGPAGGDSGVDE